VLNQAVTSNHKRRLVHDSDPDVYPRSMHRMAERMSQVYNQRKVCNGAFRDGLIRLVAGTKMLKRQGRGVA